jgi:hypothetical protein
LGGVGVVVVDDLPFVVLHYSGGDGKCYYSSAMMRGTIDKEESYSSTDGKHSKRMQKDHPSTHKAMHVLLYIYII